MRFIYALGLCLTNDIFRIAGGCQEPVIRDLFRVNAAAEVVRRTRAKLDAASALKAETECAAAEHAEHRRLNPTIVIRALAVSRPLYISGCLRSALWSKPLISSACVRPGCRRSNRCFACPGAPKWNGDREPTAQRFERCRYGFDGYFANRTAAGASSATDEPQADPFEEGAHPCSMGLWVLV
jgi:hypothetical protein